MAKVALLRTAEEVFAEKGLEGARVEEIARRAKVSKGAFYLHFESKEEAFRQVVESFLARCSALVQEPESFATLPTTPDEMLDFIYEHDLQTFEYLWQSRAFIQIVESCSGDHKYLLDSFLDHTQKNSERWIRTWKDAGLFRSNVDARVAATMICGGYRELVRRMVAAPKKPPLGAWLRDAQRFLVYGLGNEILRRAQERRDEEEARAEDAGAGTKKRSATGDTARTP
jgi:AcrR family transcriptional regulator